MKFSRRDFLKSTGLVCGAAAFPGWVLETEAAEAAAVDKHALAEIAITRAKKLGASYADIRINRYRNESSSTREQQVLNVARSQSFGFGVRVLVKGAWGFAASYVVTPESVRRITEQAVAIARANGTYQRKPIKLAPAPKVVATWKSAFEKDPFDIPVDRKIEFLLKVNEAAMKAKGASFVTSSLSFQNEQKFYASTDGSRTDQYIIRTLPFFTVTAVNRSAGDFQTRSNLASPRTAGYEFIEQYPWLKEAEQAGEESVAKLKAKPVTPGKYDLILHPSHLWLTIHESVGHSTELDRALLWEADFAGTSFLTPDKAGKLRFGSKLCNFNADRTQPHGLATVGYDDEGVPAQRWALVKDGIFVDWQTTRDLAPLIGQKHSYGCLHADSWASVPFPRMPNVSLDPAKENVSLQQLAGEVQDGILIYGNGSWSIDQQRYNFQFGGQTFWEIKKGKIGEMLRDVAYQSRTPDFWNACDGLGGPATYELNGAANDGKGEPQQANAVSHGCPVSRFRQINVLNTGKKT
ncbi:MAG TPA: metallopeptidase TldD-related protein [Candidatus Binatia bacterium]|jgi:TldD protein|nr:metallopeptidase TldD-related protein [Candidatus Binatia bacterium]